MFEICYYSTAANTFMEYDIDSILEKSRLNNLKNKISGCLLFYKNEFVQILEGDETEVKLLYSKISKDPRHHFIQKLYEGETTERLFANWNMAYYKFGEKEINKANESTFIENFIAFSQLKPYDTIAAKLFWKRAKEILGRSI
jgi:hypothetical protein